MFTEEEPGRTMRILAPEGWSRRQFLKGIGAAAGLALTAGACGSRSVASSGAGASSTTARAAASGLAKDAKNAAKLAGGPLSGKLSIYTWGQYDNPSTFKQFTAGTGSVVQLSSYSSDEELIAKLDLTKGTSGYDLVVPTGPYIPEMIAKGLLQKFDKTKLPNLKNLESQYRGLSWDKNNDYSFMKDFGTTGYVYDKTVITQPMKSWKDFITAAGSSQVSGRVSVLDSQNDVLGIAFWILGINWNTGQSRELAKAKDYILQHLAKHIKKFDSYPGSGGGLPNGEYVLSQAWNGDARHAVEDDPKRLAWVLPTPKSELWADNWSIPKGAPNPTASYAFLNYILEPAVSANELTYIGYSTGVAGVTKYLPKNIKFSDMIFLTPDEHKRLVTQVLEGSNITERTAIYDTIKNAAANG